MDMFLNVIILKGGDGYACITVLPLVSLLLFVKKKGCLIMSILRAAMILGAGALGAALGYAQGRMDAVREKVEYHRLDRDNPDYTLKNDIGELVKKTADVMSSAKDQILNSKEFDNLNKSFTRDELMHLLCNSQVFDTVIDILKANNGEFRPGYYFKKEEWDKYLKQNPLNPNGIPMEDFDPYKAMQAQHMNQQCQNTPPVPPHIAQAFGPNPPSCATHSRAQYVKPEVFPGKPPCNLPVSDKSWEELQKTGAPIPINTIIPRTSSNVKQEVSEPKVTETDGSKITVSKNK